MDLPSKKARKEENRSLRAFCGDAKMAVAFL